LIGHSLTVATHPRTMLTVPFLFLLSGIFFFTSPSSEFIWMDYSPAAFAYLFSRKTFAFNSACGPILDSIISEKSRLSTLAGTQALSPSSSLQFCISAFRKCWEFRADDPDIHDEFCRMFLLPPFGNKLESAPSDPQSGGMTLHSHSLAVPIDSFLPFFLKRNGLRKTHTNPKTFKTSPQQETPPGVIPRITMDKETTGNPSLTLHHTKQPPQKTPNPFPTHSHPPNARPWSFLPILLSDRKRNDFSDLCEASEVPNPPPKN